MFKVDPIDRQTIDGWPIAESGLPTRVVNGTREAGILFVGDLRGKTDDYLLQLRAVGRISVQDIRNFFDICKQIESGQLIFITIQQLLNLFLDKEEMTVLSGRYGLLREDADASRNYMTLQEIGNSMQLTRERIRQVEHSAQQKLHSRLASACLQPFYLYIRQFINSRQQAVDYPELHDLSGQSWLTGYNPCSIAMLMADLAPEKLVSYSRFFSNISLDSVKKLEQQAVSVLRQSPGPLGLDEIVAQVHSPSTSLPDSVLRKHVRVILDHYPHAAPTADHRYFLYPEGAGFFLVEVMRSLSLPCGYRGIANAFNARLKPRARKGAGYILKLLNEHPSCVRVDRGRYTIRESDR